VSAFLIGSEFLWIDEPSAVDQLAAIADPAGGAAERLVEYQKCLDRVRRMAQEVSREFVDVVTIENL